MHVSQIWHKQIYLEEVFFPMPHLSTNQPALLMHMYIYAYTYIHMCLYAHVAHGLFKSLGEEISCSVKVRDQRVNALPERQ